MIKKNLITSLAIAGTLVMSMTSCGDTTAETPSKKEKPITTEVKGPTIVQVAAENANFSTLVSAIKAAGLAETLSDDGPYTVFAPTNDAFGKLPEGTVTSLLEPENKKKLVGILTYHVIPGKIDAATLIKSITDNDGSYKIKTGQGGVFTATLIEGKVILTDAAGNSSTVTAADVAGSNGIIHGIDSVLMPS